VDAGATGSRGLFCSAAMCKQTASFEVRGREALGVFAVRSAIERAIGRRDVV
jgi:hypothetical protein